MKLTISTALAAATILALPLRAQTYNARVAAVMKPQGKFQSAICPLPGGDFRSASAATDLKVAIEGFSDQNNQHSAVDDKRYTDGVLKAQKAAYDALAANPKNAAAWYYLGRADLQLGDLRGADSALTRTEALAPECAGDIKSSRQKAWFALVSPSADFMKAKQNDSALTTLRDAMIISRYYPQGYYNLAGTFTNMNQTDSAIYYFKIAVEKAGTDPQFTAQAKGATYNLGYLYDQKQDYVNSAAEYRKYLTYDSTDVDVKRALAQALRLSGNTADAAKMEGQLATSGALSPNELNTMAIRLFNEKDYAGAADNFQKVLAIDPYNFDALYDLANCYLGLKDAKNLVETSRKLLAMAPMGQSGAQLLVNGYRMQSDTAKMIEAYTILQAMPINVTITAFSIKGADVKIGGNITGVAATTASGKDIAPAPITLVFELLDAKGAVVTTQEFVVPPLQANATHELAVTASGAGITDWRYHVK